MRKHSPQVQEVSASELERETKAEFPHLSPEQIQALATYLSFLVTWNTKVNLVGKRDWRSIYHHLIKDSLYLARFMAELDFGDQSLVLDLGAGAGLPGVPLRMLWSRGRYLMVEPRHKRALFLDHVLRHLDLGRTEVRRCRAEELSDPDRGADLVLSRALCPWPDFLGLARELLQPSGQALVLSNQPWSGGQTCPSPWELHQEVEYSPMPNESRYFWLFRPSISSS